MISLDRSILDHGSDSYKRMWQYSKLVDELHVIVFANLSYEITAKNDSNLFLYTTEAKRKYQYITKSIALGRKIREIDLITSQDAYETGLVGFILKKILRKPLQVQEHGDVYSTSYWRNEKNINKFKYYIGIFILKRADRVRVVSDRIKNTLVKKMKISEDKIDVIHVRTDIAKFTSTKPTLNLHKIYPEFDNIILSIGRLVRQKNIPLLINSFANLLEEKPKSLLIIVGKGDQEAHLKSLVMRRHIVDNVVFLPWTDDVVSYMKTADIFALSSNYEGWARTLIEAMASKVPIVTTNVGCVGQVLIHNQDGIVVHINDERIFTLALLKMLDDKKLKERLTTHAYQKVHALSNQFTHYRELQLHWKKTLEK